MREQGTIKLINCRKLLHTSVLVIAASSLPAKALAYDIESIVLSAAAIAKKLQERPEYQKAAESIQGMVNAKSEGTDSPIHNAALNLPVSAVTGLHEYDFGVFKALMNCDDRTASIVWRTERLDTGNFDRYNRFFIDPNLPKKCQPKSTGTYKWSGNPSYDRGHLSDSNGFDYSDEAIRASNLMINVVPQISSINQRGSWREVEKRVECMRTPRFIGDGKSLTTISGVIWGDDLSDDHFLASHGQKTPSQLFKIVVERNPSGNKSYAWIFPNDRLEPKRVNVDNYLVSPEQIERVTGYKQLRLLVPEDVYQTVAPKTPNLVNGCDLS
mgnify:CR=1 FL=1